MNETANPIYLALLCVVRCALPLLGLLAISYLLQKLGVIKPTSSAPPNQNDNQS